MKNKKEHMVKQETAAMCNSTQKQCYSTQKHMK